MRLIARFSSEKQALVFSDFLSSKRIPNQYEKVMGEEPVSYTLWIHQEEDLDQAFDYYQRFVLHPDDPFFSLKQKKEEPKPLYENIARKQAFPLLSLTHGILILCAILFFWNGRQEDRIKNKAKEDSFVSEFSLTPLQKTLFFDDPKAVQEIELFLQKHSISSLEDLKKKPLSVQKSFQIVSKIPYWKGVIPSLLEKIHKETFAEKAPLFEKIREGEFWRFVSPSFMHRDFLHIFFNMAWLLMLGKSIEIRIKKFKMLLLVLLLAAFSNTAQYMMSGAYFLGFSGVITGFAAFIWTRQRKAPWEGYPLHKTTALFLFYFVLILLFVSIGCFVLQALELLDSTSSIANTAHISGGLLGFVLGRCSFFARRLSS